MFITILSSLGIGIPLYIVWIITLIVAIINKKDYPKVSLLTITSILIFFISTVIFSVANAILPHIYINYGWSTYHMGVTMSVINIVRSLISALAWALIIYAIFGWRNRNEYLMAEDRRKE